MIKKVISILSVLMVLFFVSCASSQTDTDNSKTEKPSVEAPVVENPDDSKNDDKVIPVTEDDKTGQKDSENAEVTESKEESESTEKSEDNQTPQDTPSEEGLESEASENTSEDSSEASQTGDSEDDSNTGTLTSTDTETKVTLTSETTENNSDNPEESSTDASEENTERAESEDEEADDFADLEVPEDFEEPLVRDLYIPAEDENDTDSQEDEENLDGDSDENAELSEDSEDFVDEIIEETEPEEIIIPSRSVTLRKGENLAIIYPGSGWIYMGSLSEYNNMASKGRKLGSQDTKYTLLAKEAGTQIHHFYKVDNLTGEYIDDYIEITVLDKKGSSKTTITAPAYEEIVPAKPETPAKESKPTPEPKAETETTEESPQAKQTEKKEEPSSQSKPEQTKSGQTAPVQTKRPETVEEKTSDEPDIPLLVDEDNTEDDVINVEDDEVYASQGQDQPQINTDEILEKAKAAFDVKSFEESFTLLTEFFEYAIDRQDEALYLQGQLLESDSSVKDIKGAVQAYELLVKNYPSSIYWNDANKRIKYLKRFYYLSN